MASKAIHGRMYDPLMNEMGKFESPVKQCNKVVDDYEKEESDL